jgi:hypothetical protein
MPKDFLSFQRVFDCSELTEVRGNGFNYFTGLGLRFRKLALGLRENAECRNREGAKDATIREEIFKALIEE